MVRVTIYHEGESVFGIPGDDAVNDAIDPSAMSDERWRQYLRSVALKCAIDYRNATSPSLREGGWDGVKRAADCWFEWLMS